MAKSNNSDKTPHLHTNGTEAVSDKAKSPNGDSGRNDHREQVESPEILRRRMLRDGVLLHGPTRDRFYLLHPLVCNEVHVITKAIQEAYSTIEQVIVHRDPGTCLIADFRIGKSRGIQVIKNELSKTFPDIPLGVINAKHHDSPTERRFYIDVLTDFRHGGALYGSAAELRERFLAFIEASARSTGSDRYLLFVDEGQNWHASEFTYLRDITNDMRQRNVNLITIIFGHPELYNIRQQLLHKRRTDLVGRFLLTPREFRGLRDADELLYTLQSYDDATQCEFPPGTGISISEFFLPEAYGGGWRLKDEVMGMWNAFLTVAGRTGHKAKNIGMQWVASAIRNFLFSHYAADSPHFCCDEKAWVLAVEASGYESSLP